MWNIFNRKPKQDTSQDKLKLKAEVVDLREELHKEKEGNKFGIKELDILKGEYLISQKENGIINEKLIKLQNKYKRLETDYIKDYEEDEIISYIAEIPYIVKYFDTLITATLLKRGAIPSTEELALERLLGCIDQINKLKQSVLKIQKTKDN